MKKILFYNLHVDDFVAKPLSFMLAGRRPLKKYSFILDGIEGKGDKVNVFVDYEYSSLCAPVKFSRLPFVLRKVIVSIEVWLWIILNSLQNKVRIVTPTEAHTFDKIFIFSYKIFQRKLDYAFGQNRKFDVIVHLSHYHLYTSQKSRNIQSLSDSHFVKNLVLAGDNDFSKNEYFRNHFSWYSGSFLVLPFAVQERFSSYKEWHSRNWLVGASGTFHNFSKISSSPSIDDISKYSETLHPERKIIHDNAKNLSGLVISIISEMRVKRSRLMQALVARQASYFKTDIVDFYNSVKFAFIGEEVTGGLPIGVFEAMSCGCAVICSPDNVVGHDVEAGVHFIKYSGDILAVIRSLDSCRATEYANIAQNALVYSKNNFNADSVRSSWIEKIVD